MFNTFYSENLAGYEIKWKNVVELYRPHDNIVRHIRFGCCISKAKNIQYKYVIFIAFPQQQ